MEKYVQITLSNEAVINLELYPEVAPKSVENFVNLVKQNYYDGVIFHRIIKDFMVQTGGYIIKDNYLLETPGLKPIVGEFASNGINNPLSHELGVLSMARTNVKNSATSQFFICAAKCPWLDGEYAAFGKTTDDASNKVVLDLSNVKTGLLGQGFTDFPLEVISIKSVKLSNEKF